MRKKAELIATILMLAVLALASRKMSTYVSSGKVRDVIENRVVIDAGHGGIDPGKIGINGLEEKEANLAIAGYVREILEQDQMEVIMTRETDEMLIGSDGDRSKVGDMKARVEKINEGKPILAVSIHQNSYPQEEISGAQVFYYTHSEDGKKAAELMQDSLLLLDEKNTRKAKANDTYYILKRTQVPTIIVECGFISNAKEAELLSQEEYRRKTAEAIADGIHAYMEK